MKFGLPQTLVLCAFCLLASASTNAAVVKLKLSDIVPGSETVSLITNGDFEDLSSGNDFLPNGWGRFGNQFYGANGTGIPNTGDSLARTHADGGGANGYTQGLNLMPDTEYVMSAYIAFLGDATHGGSAEFDLGDAFNEPDDGGGSVSVSLSEADASMGYYVSGTFTTTDTGTTPTVRIFHVVPGGTDNSNWPFQPISAVWDNVAVTPASVYVAPTLVPEPASLWMMVLAAAALAYRRR